MHVSGVGVHKLSVASCTQTLPLQWSTVHRVPSLVQGVLPGALLHALVLVAGVHKRHGLSLLAAPLSWQVLSISHQPPARLWSQVPLLHWLTWHDLPSLHAVPSVLLVQAKRLWPGSQCWQPSAVLTPEFTHCPAMRHCPALTPALHTPALQVSALQVTSPGKLHAPLSAGWLQPLPKLHTSLVQALPSSHALFTGVWLQPVLGSQASVVHAWPSLQFWLPMTVSQVPVPLPHLSSVHTLPSLSQLVVAGKGRVTQPFFRSHVPIAHSPPPLQGPGMWVHWPLLHTSSVHATSSLSHAVLSAARLHAFCLVVTQVSQELPGLLAPPSTHTPPMKQKFAAVPLTSHVCALVQVPIWHIAPFWQLAPTLAAVQSLWLLPGSHTRQPSLDVAPLGKHTPAILHALLWTLWTQLPLPQTSSVHARPSSLHVALLGKFVWLHVPLLQLSAVHSFLSSQSLGMPMHAPFLQLSPLVHRSPSSHFALLLVCVQPSARSQPSLVQPLSSLQVASLGVPTHFPPLQPSLTVQVTLSSHAAVLLACLQPLALSHESSVHACPSLQSSGVPWHSDSVVDVAWHCPVPFSIHKALHAPVLLGLG